MILPTLSITFPKAVKIENTRIAVMYYTIVCGMLTFVSYNFYQADGYLEKRTPTGDQHFWVTDWRVGNADAINELNAQEDEALYCKKPDLFDYCDTTDCSEWSAIELQCIDLCTENTVSNCLETPERFVKDADSLFFPTFFHEMDIIRKTDETGAVKERKLTQKWRMVKGITNMGIGLDHEFAVIAPGSISQSDSTRGKDSKLLTVLKDEGGNIIERWEPGKSISLSLARILSIAQIDLDQIEPQLGRNLLEGAQNPEGIARRLAGVKIWVDVSYHNQFTHSVPDWTGPVAIIRIKNTVSPIWVSKPSLQVLDVHGSQRLRYSHGIRIEFSSSGAFGWVSTDEIIGWITSMLVFMGVGKKVVFFFTARCLGLISEVYRGFLFQQCSVSKECVALAARLCSHTSTFVELKDVGDTITQGRIHKRFQRIFAPYADQLDKDEIERMTNFVYENIRQRQDCDSAAITVDGFSQACAHGEPLRLTTLISIFDANRRKRLLEKLFAGPDLKKLFKSDDAVLTRQSTMSPLPSQKIADLQGTPDDCVENIPTESGVNPCVISPVGEVMDQESEMPGYGASSGASQNAGSGECASPRTSVHMLQNEIDAVKRTLDGRIHHLEKEIREIHANQSALTVKLADAYQPALHVDRKPVPGEVGVQHHVPEDPQIAESKPVAMDDKELIKVHVDEFKSDEQPELKTIQQEKNENEHNMVPPAAGQESKHTPAKDHQDDKDDKCASARSILEPAPKNKKGPPMKHAGDPPPVKDKGGFCCA